MSREWYGKIPNTTSRGGAARLGAGSRRTPTSHYHYDARPPPIQEKSVAAMMPSPSPASSPYAYECGKLGGLNTI